MLTPYATEFRRLSSIGAGAQLRDRESAAFGLDGLVKTYHRDEEIYAEGDRPEFVYEVLDGAVRTCRLLSDGRRQIEDFHFAGDCFGLELGVSHRTTAEALGQASVRVVRRSAVSELAARDHEAARRLWRLTADELRRSQEHVMMLGRRSATERVAGFLLDLVRRTDAEDELDLAMSRQDIADYLGLTIETVSRTFTQLQANRHITTHGCRHIVLCDAERLAELCS